MTRRMRLSDAGILRLRPGGKEYTVWDTAASGLGVRVLPSGSRGYVVQQRSPGAKRRVSLGSAMLKSVREARRECLQIQLAGNAAGTGTSPPPAAAAPLFGDYVADPWMAGMRDRWKPSTLKSVQSVLRSRLLPAFGDLPLDRIAPADVDAWFDRFSATSPGNANKGLALLRQIMNHAVDNGHVAVNPARLTRMNPRPRLTRFLSAEEIVRLHEALDACVAERPDREMQADIIRLLLYTGSRKSEIKDLRWSEVCGDALRLAGVRLHDLRHTYASQAVMQGIPLPVVARLLGHSEARMTLRYAHVGDREIVAAADRIGQAISRALDGPD